MQKKNILLAVIAVAGFAQASGGTSLTQSDLNEASQKLPVIHETSAGNIVCRDPQIEFDKSRWMTADPIIREHMLVDIFTKKRWLLMDRSEIEKLLAIVQLNQASVRLEPDPLPDFPNCVRFDLYPVVRCGNVPCLYIQFVFDAQKKLSRYRSSYYEDGGTPTHIDSKWVE